MDFYSSNPHLQDFDNVLIGFGDVLRVKGMLCNDAVVINIFKE